MSRPALSFLLWAALVMAAAADPSARAPTRTGLDGWLAVDFSGTTPRVLYDVRTEGGQLLGTETTVPVQVVAALACAGGGCRAGTVVDLGATLAGGAFVLRTGVAQLPRGNRPEPVVDAPLQLVDASGAVLASGTATMYFTRVGSGPAAAGPVRWWYLPVRAIYRFGADVAPFPDVTTPPDVSGPREMSGTFTGGSVMVDVGGCCRQSLSFDVTAPGVRIVGSSTEPGSVPVQSLCPWPGCQPGTAVSLSSDFRATYQASGDASVAGEVLSPAYYSGGFAFFTDTVTIPDVDAPEIVLQAPFTVWSTFQIFSTSLAREGDTRYLWATGTFTGAGTATLVMDRVLVGADGAPRLAYTPRRIVYALATPTP